jgi:hypothetical protein
MYGAAREALERWQDMSRRLLEPVEVLTLFPILVLGAQATGRTEPRPCRCHGPSVAPGAAEWAQGPGRQRRRHGRTPTPRDLQPDDTVVAMLDRIACMQGMETACFVLEIDDWSEGGTAHRPETARDVLDECDRRLRAALRGDDLVADLGMGTRSVSSCIRSLRRASASGTPSRTGCARGSPHRSWSGTRRSG